MGTPQRTLRPTPSATFANLLAGGYWPVGIYPKGAKMPRREEPAKGKEPYGVAWGAERWTLEKWHGATRAHPGLGLGICLGPSRGPGGTWLVDIEGDGPEADASRLVLFGGEVVSTMGWSSARGSHQLLVADVEKLTAIMPGLAPLEVKKTPSPGVYKSDMLPGLELRIGGYKPDGTVKQCQSVCPPTPGTDGKPRTWLGPAEAAMVPDAFYRTLAGLVVPKSAGPADATAPARSVFASMAISPGNRDHAWAKSALEQELGKLASTQEGGRNDQLNRAAFALGRFVPRYLDRQSAEDQLLVVAKQIGLSFSESKSTIASGLDAGVANPKERPEKKPARPAMAAKLRTFKPDDGDADGGEQDPVIDGVEDHRFNLTDLGNAERLVRSHGDSLRYCHPWKRWLVFDGRRWETDNTGAPRRRAKATVRAIYGEAAVAAKEDDRKALGRWAVESEKRDRINAMLSLAEAEASIPILPDHMDVDPWLFNCANGTIELRSGRLKPHDRLDYLTKMSPVPFDPAATCPLWLGTLDLFFASNFDLIEYFQKICGYAMCGVVTEQIMPIAYGKGANGKSTMLNTIMDVFGRDYAMKAPPDMLMAKLTDSHPTDRADLFRKRLVVAIETEAGRDLNETMTKELTGSDKIRARRMREDFWEFDPTHTLLLATNHKPQIRGSDDGIWRRLKLIPFQVSRKGKAADKDMPNKLKAEFPGILAWCVEGCLKWQRDGLDEPGEVAKASAEYRSQQDVIGGFLDAETIQNVQLRVKAGDLFARYQEWCRVSNEPAMSMMKFGFAIEERDIVKTRSGGIWYQGIALKSKENDTEKRTGSPF